MKVLAYSHRFWRATEETKVSCKQGYDKAAYRTVSVKLSGPKVDVVAEIVTVPVVGPVV
jgi:hypothetical protein